MRLVVFGATGATGLEIVKQALALGHDVRAFVRDPARLALRHERLEIARGDVYDDDAVDAAVAETDVVIGALGIRRGAPKTLVADGTQRILAAATLRPNLEDKERYEQLVRASDLDWTLVRPPRLTGGPATGRVRVGTDLRMGMAAKVSRADVAAFVLAQVGDDTWVGKAPAIVA